MPLAFASGRRVWPPDGKLVNNPAGSWTISLWIAPGSSSSSTRSIVYLNPGNVLQITGGVVQFIYGGGIKTVGSAPLWAGSLYGPWTHVAVTKNATTEVRMYLNGELAASQTSAISGDTAQAAQIGSYNGKSDFYTGFMAALKVWDCVLSAVGVRREAASLAPVSVASLRSWFPFQRGYTQLNSAAGSAGTALSSAGSAAMPSVRFHLSWSGGGAGGVITPTAAIPPVTDLAGARVSNAPQSRYGVINVEGGARYLAGALVDNVQSAFAGQIAIGATADGFRVLADWTGDGLFGHELSDLANRVSGVQFSGGWQTLYGMIAEPATMTLTLNNSDGAFNADGALGGLLRLDTLLKWGHAYGGATRWIATLRLVKWSIEPGSYSGRTATLECADWNDSLLDSNCEAPLEVGAQSTGVAINKLFARGAIPDYPRPNELWILGVSKLGRSTILAAYDAYVTTDTGETALPYLGNNLADGAKGLNAGAFIREMCAAEMDGRFRYVTTGADGTPNYQYWGRSALATTYSPEAVAEVGMGAFVDASYESYPVVNDLTVTLNPRSVGAAGSVIANSNLAFRLKAGDARTFTLRFRNPDNPAESCGATTVITPVASLDYTANENPDGTGADKTSQLSVASLAGVSSAEVTVTNSGDTDVYVTLLQVRGTPLLAGSALEVRKTNTLSAGEHGIHPARFEIAGIDNVEQVERYAERYVGRFGVAQSHYRAVMFRAGGVEGEVDSNLPAGLLRYARNDADGGGPAGSMMALLRLAGGWVDGARGGTYLVAGVQHSVDASGWFCTLLLEDASSAIGVWILGSATMSVLGSTTQLGF